MEPNHLTTFDLGIKNPAYATGDASRVDEPGYHPTAHRANFLIRERDGRVFVYKEGEAPDRILEFIDEHKSIVTRPELILMEKQMTHMKSILERGCIVIETALHTCLKTLKVSGLIGAEVGVIRPLDWKNYHEIEPSPDWMTPKQKHEDQKAKSIARFRKLFGDDHYFAVAKRWGKEDDVIEAELMWIYAARNFNKLKRQCAYKSSHEREWGSNKKRITEQDRARFTLGTGVLKRGRDEDEGPNLIRPEELAAVQADFDAFKKARSNSRD